MNLSKYGSEPAYWTITSDVLLDGEAPKVAIGTEDTWHQAVWDDETPALERRARLLVAGPLAPAAPGAVVVPVGQHRTWTRTVVGGAAIVRQASRLYCS